MEGTPDAMITARSLRSVGLLLSTLSVPLLAAERSDQRLEEIAESSFNLRQALDRRVEVNVRDGVATLTGTVADEAHRRLAEESVASLNGVRKVDNRIQVISEGSDAWIALTIRTLLLGRRDLSLTHTDVDVQDGVVTLRGTVDSRAQKERTAEYVKKISGVRGVRNELQIAPDRPADPRERAQLDRAAGVGRGETVLDIVAAERAPVNDAALTAEITAALDEATGANTAVAVRDGRVVLTGRAGSAAEKARATALAERVRGVRSVDNRMSIGR